MSVLDNLLAFKNNIDPKLLDLRSEISNELCLKHSTWIPVHDLGDRWCEFPTKNNNLSILVSENSEAEFLKANFIKERGWLVDFIFIATDEFWSFAKECDLVVKLPVPYRPIKILFSPCPFLTEWFFYIENSLIKDFSKKFAEQSKELSFTCLDVGCGSGRDLAWIGLKSSLWYFSGIDYVKGALNRTRLLLSNVGLSDKLISLKNAKFLPDGNIKILQETSSIADNVDALFKSSKQDPQFHLVLCVRILERASFKHLRQLVKPGGFLLFSTFVDFPKEYSYEHPSLESGRRLHKGELSKVFSSEFGFEIITDIIQPIEDGRPVNSFLVKKKYRYYN